MAAQLFLTTQPGWAFATLAELRARGVGSYARFCHRDSSLLVPVHPPLAGTRLLTPADVFGGVLTAGSSRGRDATEQLARDLERLDPAVLQQFVLRWLRWLPQPHRRRYSIGSEIWGDTALHRAALAGLVGTALRRAIPQWKEVSSGEVRVYCKADPQLALLGVRLYSNLGPHDTRSPGRPGALREHLACGLLTLARVRPDAAVLDPFMGTGTILRAASRRFGVRTCIGAEIDPQAYRIARRSVRAPDARLFGQPFESLDVERLPAQLTLVSNLPFGVRFAQVPTARLLKFLARLRAKVVALALLMGREQAAEVGPALGLRTKHVLVLGQPAAIVYAVDGPG